MRTFVRVAERGNLSAVARELGIGQSTVTRHLRELEDAVGASLLSRTTRHLKMTAEGARYYADSTQILRLVDQASAKVQEMRGASAGTIRISCTAAFGVLHATRLLFAFQDDHPGIGIDLGLTDERIDLVRDGVDIALRLGPLAESAMKLRPLGWSRRMLVAAPRYLALRGRPLVPEELSAHEGICMSNVAGSDAIALQGPEGTCRSVPFGGSFRVDHGLAAREALLSGRGVAPAHRWLVDDLIADGRLEPIMPEYSLPPVQLSMLILPDRAQIPRNRLLIDFLARRIGDVPGIFASRADA